MTAVTVLAWGSESQAPLINRAIAAYYRSRQSDPPGTPSGSMTFLGECAGKRYVVIRTLRRDVLGVYRVRNDGVLKRLVRWPADLAAPPTTAALSSSRADPTQ